MAKQPTKSQRKRWELIRGLGCIVCRAWLAEIHHCGTGAGGRKDHDKVIPLCPVHHTGIYGIHKIGRKRFAENYGTEEELMQQVEERLAA
ncbi:MAG: Ref family recombination enhancement nuclease [Methylobacter sp.]|uniref:Ref family recombination enhancement nuclease n=1 Tax=Methylobacter sp. TaxID=2051955 RepID=UPI0025D562DE|nr:Ref family recombination enhancement nuclease [Methylobacter sp.]MCK9622185.1 Ref family recombination enhancement nuclease [Methylobacter sp.]